MKEKGERQLGTIVHRFLTVDATGAAHTPGATARTVLTSTILARMDRTPKLWAKPSPSLPWPAFVSCSVAALRKVTNTSQKNKLSLIKSIYLPSLREIPDAERYTFSATKSKSDNLIRNWEEETALHQISLQKLRWLRTFPSACSMCASCPNIERGIRSAALKQTNKTKLPNITQIHPSSSG